MNAQIAQLAVGPMQNFTYVISDTTTGVAAVVDPGWEAERIVQACHEVGCRLSAILLTHTHWDHIGAIEELCATTPLPIYVHTAELDGVPKVGSPIHTTNDGSHITVGGLDVHCLHTPGHSPGGQCLLLDTVCFSGDTLFINACGRVDLDGSDPDAMWQSLQRLAALPPATTVYPGHDYGPTPTSTIGEQLQTNPYLRAKAKDEFFRRRGV